MDTYITNIVTQEHYKKYSRVDLYENANNPTSQIYNAIKVGTTNYNEANGTNIMIYDIVTLLNCFFETISTNKKYRKESPNCTDIMNNVRCFFDEYIFNKYGVVHYLHISRLVSILALGLIEGNINEVFYQRNDSPFSTRIVEGFLEDYEEHYDENPQALIYHKATMQIPLQDYLEDICRNAIFQKTITQEDLKTYTIKNFITAYLFDCHLQKIELLNAGEKKEIEDMAMERPFYKERFKSGNSFYKAYSKIQKFKPEQLKEKDKAYLCKLSNNPTLVEEYFSKKD